MARTRTLLELRGEVRARADIEGDPHVTDTEIDRFINQSAAALHEQVVLASEDDYTEALPFSTAAATESYSLGTKFYKLISVEVTINGVTRQIPRWTFEERARYQNVATWGLASQPIAYRLVGADKIFFSPTPDGIYAVTCWIVKAFADLTVDASTYDGRDGWEEWVVLDAAIKCKTKSEEDVRDLQRERAEVWARITKAFGTKDQARPDSVVEVIGRGYDPFGMGPLWRR